MTAGATDLYNVAYFERIAKLSQSDFLGRIQPVSRRVYHLRNLKTTNIIDGDYLCGGEAEWLILEWKVQRGRWIDKRDGVVRTPLDLTFYNLLHRAGSSTYASQSVTGMRHHQ